MKWYDSRGNQIQNLHEQRGYTQSEILQMQADRDASNRECNNQLVDCCYLLGKGCVQAGTIAFRASTSCYRNGHFEVNRKCVTWYSSVLCFGGTMATLFNPLGVDATTFKALLGVTFPSWIIGCSVLECNFCQPKDNERGNEITDSSNNQEVVTEQPSSSLSQVSSTENSAKVVEMI